MPFLRDRFSGFSGAGTAGIPNSVVCFVLSFFCPRPFEVAAPGGSPGRKSKIQHCVGGHFVRNCDRPFHLPVSAASALSKKLSLLCNDLLFGPSRAKGFRELSAAPLGFFANGLTSVMG